jgi:hypothetical protein
MTADNVVRALAYVGIDASDLGQGHVDLGRTPCDVEYAVRARVNIDGSVTLHVLTEGQPAPDWSSEYGTYETARALALAASNVMHD